MAASRPPAWLKRAVVRPPRSGERTGSYVIAGYPTVARGQVCMSADLRQARPGPGVDLAHGAQVPGGAACGDAPGRVGVFVDGCEGPGRYREGSRVWCGGFAYLAELGRPAGQAVPGHQRGDPAVTELGGHPDRVMAQRGDPDGYLGGGRLAQAQRARGRGVAELGGLAGQQRTDLGHDVAQLGGWRPG